MSERATTISIIICTYSEARWDDLVAAVESVRQQTLLPEEIIVVIDHSPSLQERVRIQFPDVVAVENTEAQGASGSRNSGIAHANGQLIVCLDDDAVAMPDWLQELREQFADPQVLGSGGVIEPLWMEEAPTWFPEEFYWVVGCTYRGLPQMTAPIRNLIGANMSFRREVFDSVGGFRSEIGRVGTWPIGCEETEWCIRAQQKYVHGIFLYHPQAKVSQRVPRSRSCWRYFCARCYAEGLSKAMVSRYVGSREGLASERAYTLRTLPRGIMRGVLDGLLHHDVSGLVRAGAIIVGLGVTMAGYLSQKAIMKGFERNS